VVAWAGAGPYRTRPCYDGVGEFSVYTERSARRTGAGRAVLAGLLAACEARGFWKLVSRVFPENTASRRLCQSLGFREVGARPGRP
jgi:L-amino acid N-acyltransferase YncA